MADWGGSKTKGRSALDVDSMMADEAACMDIDDSLKEAWEVKGTGKSRAEKKKAAKARKKLREAEEARVKAVADLEAKALSDQLAKEKEEADKMKKLQEALAAADDWDAVDVDVVGEDEKPSAAAAAPAAPAAAEKEEEEEELDENQEVLQALDVADGASRERYAKAICGSLGAKPLVKFCDELFKKSSNNLALTDVKGMLDVLAAKCEATKAKEAQLNEYDQAADDDDDDFM